MWVLFFWDRTCDASLSPINGLVGDCTSELIAGQTCTPQCLAGYALSGVSTCSLTGVYTAAICTSNLFLETSMYTQTAHIKK